MFFQTFIQLSFFGIYNYISNRFYFNSLEPVDCQHIIYFSTMYHKTCGHKIDNKGLNLLLSLFHQNNPPIFYYEPKPNIYYIDGIRHVNT